MENKPHPRKLKHNINSVCKRLKYGMYVIDCRYHPCRITKGARICYQDLYGTYFECISLVTGTGNSCSVMHCGSEPISQQLAFEMTDYWKEHGTNAILIKYHGYTQEQLDHFDKLDKEWNFDKPEPSKSI